MSAATAKPSLRRTLTLIALFIISSVAIVAIMLVTMSYAPSTTDLQEGDVTSQDIQAPYAVSYTSEILTEQQRERAADAVASKYSTADTSIARQQLDRLRAALAYITSVRSDLNASTEQKLADLAALQDIQIRQETAQLILELVEPRWQAVQQEAILVLERVMRNTIRDDYLVDARNGVPNLVSLALPEDQASVVAELAAAFIAPNSFYSENLTEAARLQAREGVVPIVINYATGETVIERGKVVNQVDIEALQHLGLARPELRWQDKTAVIVLVVLTIGLAILYFRRNPAVIQNTPDLITMIILFTMFLVGGRVLSPLHYLIPYLYPVAAYALVVAALFGAQLALVTVIPLILLITYGAPNALELILYYGVSSLFGVLIPKREQRITAYLWSGLTIAASGAATVTAYLLPQPETEWNTLAPLAGMALLNGFIGAGLTVLLQYLLASMLGQITPLQLLELSRPDHPLLVHLLHNAPGTYQHSLQVANLAEQAAEAIGADGLLTRIGAIYHDIGKTKNPQFFIENQIPGHIDTHEDLDPAESAAIIISHVTDGLELARQNRLPRRIQNFIAEHHGTLLTRYQWTQAVKAVNGDTTLLDKSHFAYPGPSPQSRETALVMLADSCEARVRAQRPEDGQALREMIKDTIDKRVADGQLDSTDITLQDLKTIADTFTASLRGIYHPRVEYPSLDVPTQPILQHPEDDGVIAKELEQA
jgi:putative nucleotidyltransferase with HDIG domain